MKETEAQRGEVSHSRPHYHKVEGGVAWILYFLTELWCIYRKVDRIVNVQLDEFLSWMYPSNYHPESSSCPFLITNPLHHMQSLSWFPSPLTSSARFWSFEREPFSMYSLVPGLFHSASRFWDWSIVLHVISSLCFFYCSVVFHCVNPTQCMCLVFVDGHLGLFHFGTIKSRASVNILVWDLPWWTCVLTSFKYILNREWNCWAMG